MAAIAALLASSPDSLVLVLSGAGMTIPDDVLQSGNAITDG